MDVDVEAVAEILRHVDVEILAPRVGSVALEQKAPGEVVTEGDRLAEQVLAGLLRDVLDAPVVGEEGVDRDPGRLAHLDGAGPVWLIDPIDGTTNFAAGDPHYAIMVALVVGGRATAGWIFQPAFDRMAIAVRGAGATLNGRRVEAVEPPTDRSLWRGIIKDRFLPDPIRPRVLEAARTIGGTPAVRHCAGVEYPSLVAGQTDFLLYWRTLPWDHGPGVLYAEEAGCRALRPSGRSYELLDGERGLLVAHSAVASQTLERLLG